MPVYIADLDGSNLKVLLEDVQEVFKIFIFFERKASGVLKYLYFFGIQKGKYVDV